MNRILTFSITLLCLLGFSNLAVAQTDSGTTPAIGTTHSYWVNSTDGSSQDSGVGNDYLWYITQGDLTTTNTSDFTITTSTYADGSTAVANLYAIDITWAATSAGSTYYLHIIESDANGCSNHKVEIINPFSDFQLAIANVAVTDLDTDEDADLASCAPSVTPTLVSAAIAYDYGTTALYYKVVASNIAAADYTFGYNITVTDGPSVVSATYGTGSGTTYTSIGTLTVGSDATQVVTNTDLNSTIYIKVELDNNQGDDTTFANAFEGTAEHSVTVTLLSGTQDAASANLGTDTDENQIVSARPSTSSIGSN
jgi:hypothetical protein